MMHHHNLHHQAVAGHPGQHLNHHSLPGHHQMGPHQMHRDQNRMVGAPPGQAVRMAHCGPPPRPMMPPPPGLHTHRPPPPPRHLPPPHPHHMALAPRPGVMVTMPPNMDAKPPHLAPAPASAQVLNQPSVQQQAQQSPHQQQPQVQQPVHQQQPQVQQPTHQHQQHVQLAQQPAQQQVQQSPDSPQTVVGQILPDISGNVANSKEKTSMCLVNELARFNKIQHQYRLTSEQGPAHRKRFVVSLRLGGGEGGGPVEEYSAEGSRIRAAQHAVAAEALRRTAYPRPPPRAPRAQRTRRANGAGAIMPTVELNALTMKLGETAVYTLESPPATLEAPNPRNGTNYPVPYRPCPSIQLQTYNRNSRYYNQNNRFVNNFKYQNNNFKDQIVYQGSYRVRLNVGGRMYHGEGGTPQAARHDAASQALRDLRQHEELDSCSAEPVSHRPDGEAVDDLSDLKSPVSMVHEIALKFNLPVNFDVKSEKGPPHMKVFVTTCTVAEHVTEGEGNSKKTSKKRAAEKMLEELKKLPSVKKTVSQPENRKPKRKQQQPKKRTRNLIKEKADTATPSETNPVSLLLQWSSVREVREPQYSIFAEEAGVASRGGKRGGYSARCEVAGQDSVGTGVSKKLAKRDAAQKMLQLLKVTSGTPLKLKVEGLGTLPTSSPAQSEGRGRQLAPGLLLVQDHAPAGGYLTPNKSGVNAQTTAIIAKELLRVGNSPTADALAKQDHRAGAVMPISSSVVSSSTGGAAPPTSPQPTNQVIRPKDQLLYLAKLLGFGVQFTEFPKGNHEEFLSLVTLSTEPPLICHGVGPTTEQSQDQSALAALQNLSQMGIPGHHTTPDGMRDLTHSASRGGLLTNGIAK